MNVTKFQILKSLQNFFNQQLIMGNAVRHSVKAIFLMWIFRDTVALIKAYCDYYFAILILNFIWKTNIFSCFRDIS